MAYPDGLSTQTAYPDCPAYLVQLLQVGRNNSLVGGTSPPQLEHLLKADGGCRRVEVGVLSLWGVRGVQLGSEVFVIACLSGLLQRTECCVLAGEGKTSFPGHLQWGA